VARDICRALVHGAMFSCLDPVLTIAAGVGFRSPFMAPMDKRDEVGGGVCSDLALDRI